MASTAPYRQLCTKAAAVWARWGSAHDSAAGLLRTAGNVLSRLGPMQQAGHYGSLADDAELQARVLAKQLLALEDILASVRRSILSMHDILRDAEKLATEGLRLLGDAPPADAVWQCRGADPSAAQCFEALQDLHRMLRDELALKMTVVEKIRYDSSEADVAALVAVFSAQPNVDAVRLTALFVQVAEASKLKQ